VVLSDGVRYVDFMVLDSAESRRVLGLQANRSVVDVSRSGVAIVVSLGGVELCVLCLVEVQLSKRWVA
jgi:hypothetical protein